jgi:hypothetical protein
VPEIENIHVPAPPGATIPPNLPFPFPSTSNP